MHAQLSVYRPSALSRLRRCVSIGGYLLMLTPRLQADGTFAIASSWFEGAKPQSMNADDIAMVEAARATAQDDLAKLVQKYTPGIPR